MFSVAFTLFSLANIQIARHEYVLGMDYKTLSLQSRLFLMPRMYFSNDNFASSFVVVDVMPRIFTDYNLTFFIPDKVVLLVMQQYIEKVEMVRKREDESQTFAPCSLWTSMRNGSLEGFDVFVRFNPTLFACSNCSLERWDYVPLPAPPLPHSI